MYQPYGADGKREFIVEHLLEPGVYLPIDTLCLWEVHIFKMEELAYRFCFSHLSVRQIEDGILFRITQKELLTFGSDQLMLYYAKVYGEKSGIAEYVPKSYAFKLKWKR